MGLPEPSPEKREPLLPQEVEGYRMTYTLMIALSAQRFMAVGILYAAAGFVASNSASEKLTLLPAVGLVAILVGVAVAGRQIVRSLNEATVNLLNRCAKIEVLLDIPHGFGRHYLST